MERCALTCTGLPDDWTGEVIERLAAAARGLRLDERFGAIEICADDLAGQQAAWLHFSPGADPSLPNLTIYCPPGAFDAGAEPVRGLFPSREIWEQAPAPVETGPTGELSGIETERFLHHQLLLARDLADGDLQPAGVPGSLTEAFLAAWSVTIDGRLARRGLPGYDLAFRRGSFSRLFSGAGVLMPDHWEIFQALWDGGVSGFADVLSASRRLPRL